MHLQAGKRQGWPAPPRSGKRQRGPSRAPAEGAWPCRHLDFGGLASRTVRETSLILSQRVYFVKALSKFPFWAFLLDMTSVNPPARHL